MDTDTIVKIVLALLPFVSLFGGFLLFHWGSLKTVVITCLLEFIIAVAYYHGSPVQTAEAALWGSVAVWPTLLITFTAQIFGYCYRKTGLMRVMLDSISELLPRDEVGHACALLGPVAGVFSNFEARASYPVVVPGLVELGYNPVQASGAALVFLTWIMPFQGLMIGAIIANLATHVPIPNIATAVGQFAIPDIFLCTYATFHILGLKFFNRESQIFFWLTTLPYVLSIFAFTQLWPQFYALGLIGGAILNIACLYTYGMWRRRRTAGSGAAASPSAIPAPASLSAAATPVTESAPDWSRIARGWGPLIVGFAYAAFMLSAWGSSILSHLSFSVAAWGFKPVAVNLFNTPAMPVFIGALSAYLFRTERSNMLTDLWQGFYRGFSPMLTFMFGVGIMYLLVFTKQIDFLGSIMSGGGETLFKLVDAGLVVAGGTIFGSGTPTIFTFSTMQLPAVAAFGLPLTLLLGMVVVGGIGVTNACKPPNLRFVANLVDVKSEHDWEIFAIGLKWVGWQVALFTALLFILVPFWK